MKTSEMQKWTRRERVREIRLQTEKEEKKKEGRRGNPKVHHKVARRFFAWPLYLVCRPVSVGIYPPSSAIGTHDESRAFVVRPSSSDRRFSWLQPNRELRATSRVDPRYSCWTQRWGWAGRRSRRSRCGSAFQVTLARRADALPAKFNNLAESNFG